MTAAPRRQTAKRVKERAKGEGEGEGEGEDGPGSGSGDVFIELDYSNATSTTEPSFRYSDTPGFGPAQWAYEDPFGTGTSTPDAWDRFNNMRILDDFRLDKVLEIGSGQQELQLMLGLSSSVSYEQLVVEIDGDETANGGVASYDVFNPLVGCGAADDPTAITDGIGRHTKVLDLGTCLIPGRQVQAIRVDVVRGTLGLKRMKVTLRNARW